MSKTAPGPKELAQRELGRRTREAKGSMNEVMFADVLDHENMMARRKSRPKSPKKTAKPKIKIPYAGKPKGNEQASAYGIKHRKGKTK